MLQYKEELKNNVNDGFSQNLKETFEYFNEQGINVLGKFKEIIGETPLVESYIEKLCEDLPADEAEDVSHMLTNSHEHLLESSSVSGIAPYAGMTWPVIRKMWMKIGMTSVIPTEVTKKPAFSISWYQPYAYIDGNKVKLPEGFKTHRNEIASRKPLNCDVIPLPASNVNVMTTNGQTKLANDRVSSSFYVSEVTMECLDAGGVNPESVPVTVKMERDIRGTIRGEVVAAHSDTTETTDKIFGSLDLETGELNLVALEGNAQSVKVTGWYSSENHERSQEVSYEIEKKEIDIDEGDPLNASLPRQFITDSKALYNVDAAAKLTDLLSNVFATKVDFKLQDFLEESYQLNAAGQYTREFDCRPSFGYAHSPKEWREELKTVIDHLALSIQDDSYCYDGHFVLYGNPIDMRLVPNLNWNFVASKSERGGVRVGFNVGAVGGDSALRYSVVSIPNVPKGSIRVVFIPNMKDLMTYKYIPYTFNIESSETGYRNPNNPNIPSITMIKRDTVEELLPICGKINILNNNGVLPAAEPPTFTTTTP
jgi:hypothetical protein